MIIVIICVVGFQVEFDFLYFICDSTAAIFCKVAYLLSFVCLVLF